MSKIKADTLSNLLDTKSVPVDTVVQGSAKAWLNFNGTGTVAIRAAFNVSSLTDIGVGQYAITFATPFADANYTYVGTSEANRTLGNYGTADTAAIAYVGVYTTSTTAAFDSPYNKIAVFR